jgi:uncharacterized membrane protein (UPF0127 family)
MARNPSRAGIADGAATLGVRRGRAGESLVGTTNTEHRLDERFDGLERRGLAGGLTLLVATTRRSRRRGLAKLDALAPDHGLLLGPCRSVHTVAMRFALDLVWLDGAGRPVRLDEAVAPRRVRTCLRARSVVETAAGGGARFAAALEAAARAA